MAGLDTFPLVSGPIAHACYGCNRDNYKAVIKSNGAKRGDKMKKLSETERRMAEETEAGSWVFIWVFAVTVLALWAFQALMRWTLPPWT